MGLFDTGTANGGSLFGKVGSSMSNLFNPPEQYKVQQGDTLHVISKTLGVPVKELAKINHIKDPNKIQIGQMLNWKTQKMSSVDEFNYIEDEEGLPRGTLYALMMTESSGNPFAKSKKGAEGAFQLMPKTSKHYNVNPYNLHESAKAAAQELIWQLASHEKQTKKDKGLDLGFGRGDHKQDFARALASYNWGHGNVRRHGIDLSRIDKFQRGKSLEKHGVDKSETTGHRQNFTKFWEDYHNKTQQPMNPMIIDLRNINEGLYPSQKK
jgi:LysM repeat protein